MQWSVAMIQRLSGERLWITRCCMLLISFLTLYAFYLLLRVCGLNRVKAAMIYFIIFFTPTFYYFKFNPLPDNAALCFAVYYLFLFSRAFHSRQLSHHVLAAACLSLAGACKLPYLFFGAASAVYIINSSTINWRTRWKILLINILATLPTCLWYYNVIPGWQGNQITEGIFAGSFDWSLYLRNFMANQFDFIPQLIISPAGVILLTIGIYYFIKNSAFRNQYIQCILAAVVASYSILLYELNVLSTNHDYYFMTLLPFYMLAAAYGLKHIKLSKKTAIYSGIFVLCLSSGFCLIKTKHDWEIKHAHTSRDVFDNMNELRHAVPSDAKCIFIRDASGHIFPYKTDKHGYVFNDLNTPSAWIEDCIESGNASYVYSDSRAFDGRPDIAPLLASEIGQFGDIKVFKLVVSE